MRESRYEKLRWPSSVAVLLGLVIGSCRGSTEPEAALRGTFVLRTVDDVPLPVDRSNRPTYHLLLVADTLRFDGKGAATERVAMQEQIAGQPVTSLSYSLDFNYRIADDSVYLVIRCPVTADCVGSFTGEAGDRDRLLLQSGAEMYLFVRVKAK
jgi:hypothetical protein